MKIEKAGHLGITIGFFLGTQVFVINAILAYFGVYWIWSEAWWDHALNSWRMSMGLMLSAIITASIIMSIVYFSAYRAIQADHKTANAPKGDNEVKE